MKYKIYNEEAVEWAKHYDKKKFHALLCDPPYHLSSIVKRFGKNGSAPAKYGTDGAFARASAGFMGKTWDGGDVAFQPETWAAFGELLYPGAFGMAFSASRNWHRLAVAIEDAGFILHPTIFGYCYGSGFPKATRVKGHPEFDGHRYGLQALKPALEPIIVFQRPYEGRPIENITSTGAGALNVDGGRIGTDAGWSYPNGRGGSEPHHMQRGERNGIAGVPSEATSGRWPANFILLDDESAAALDRQSGELAGPWGKSTTVRNNGAMFDVGDRFIDNERFGRETGGASRFFFRVREQLDEADPVKYQAKASRSERDAGLEGMPLIERRTHGEMGVDDTGNSHNTTGQKPAVGHNPHPTVKPLALAKYLATLLLPPVEYAPRRILVPFSGVGSEMIGAGQAGWEQVVGVEFDKESNYVEIAKARIDYWCGDENPSV